MPVHQQTVTVSTSPVTRWYGILFIFCVTLPGCLKLDPFLFNGTELSTYALDTYTGERELEDALSWVRRHSPDTQYPPRELSFTSGKETIYGQLLHSGPACDSTDTLLLFLHGNKDHIDYYWPRTRLLAAVGYPVLVIDYRGFGKSTGVTSETGLYEDTRAALAGIATQLGNPQVVIYAYSLGSLAGCDIARSPAGRVIMLVCEAPIGSVGTMGQDATHLNIPGSYISTYTGNNAEKIKQVAIPYLWIHGDADDMLDYTTHGKAIWDSYRGERGCAVRVRGAVHYDCPRVLGYERYLQTLRHSIRGISCDS